MDTIAALTGTGTTGQGAIADRDRQAAAIEAALNAGLPSGERAAGVGSPATRRAGAVLESSAAAYRTCSVKQAESKAARPPSCIRVLSRGVYDEKRIHNGWSLAIDGVDGHTIRYISVGGVACRALDNDPDCTAW